MKPLLDLFGLLHLASFRSFDHLALSIRDNTQRGRGPTFTKQYLVLTKPKPRSPFSLFRENDTHRYKIIPCTLFSHAPSVLHPYPLLNRRQPVYRSFLVSGRPKRSPIIVLLGVVTSFWKSRDGQFSSKHQYVSLFRFFSLAINSINFGLFFFQEFC